MKPEDIELSNDFRKFHARRKGGRTLAIRIARTTFPDSFSPTMSEKNIRWLAIPGLIFAFLMGMGYICEWYIVGIEAKPDVIASYNFGAEVMLENGGWHYSTAGAYGGSMILGGIFMIGAIVLLIRAMVRRSRMDALWGYGAILVDVIVNQVVNYMITQLRDSM